MGRKRLEVGSRVSCRYFNVPEDRFYGDHFTATVTALRKSTTFLGNPVHYKTVRVKRDDGFELWLWRKEVKRIL